MYHTKHYFYKRHLNTFISGTQCMQVIWYECMHMTIQCVFFSVRGVRGAWSVFDTAFLSTMSFSKSSLTAPCSLRGPQWGTWTGVRLIPCDGERGSVNTCILIE